MTNARQSLMIQDAMEELDGSDKTIRRLLKRGDLERAGEMHGHTLSIERVKTQIPRPEAPDEPAAPPTSPGHARPDLDEPGSEMPELPPESFPDPSPNQPAHPDKDRPEPLHPSQLTTQLATPRGVTHGASSHLPTSTELGDPPRRSS